MKKLLIVLVSMMATVAFANDPAATTAPTGDAQKTEMPKDAAHGATHAEKKEEKKMDKKADKKAKKNKKAKAEGEAK